MVTRNDVAKHAEVSSATVSRVLNNSNKVSDKLKERVLASARELGYKPNIAAKSLKTRKTYQIAYIIPDITNLYYTEIYKGINDYAATKGYTCHIIAPSHKGWEEKIKTQPLDGIILAIDLTESIKKTVLELNIPVVVQSTDNRIKENSYFAVVYHDVYSVLAESIDYLYKKGHTNLGLITKNIDTIHYQVYCDCLKKHNIQFKDDRIVLYNKTGFHYETGYISMIELLNRRTNVTAVITQNDMIAIGAMSAAGEYGMKIPKDIAFVGCSDTVAAKYSNPSLTTIKLFKEHQGIKTAEMLFDLIDGKAVESYKFDTSLIVRKST